MTSLAQLQPDWLDALAILRRSIDSHDIREVWERFAPSLNSDSTHPWLIVPVEDDEAKPNAGLIELVISTREQFLKLPCIERVEIMTFAACGAWFSLHYPGDPFTVPREAFQHLCFRAGCWFKNTPDIRERWRLIDFYRAANELPNACFEDRPSCKICHQPVATNAGAFVTPTEATSDYTGTQWAENNMIYKANVHEECMRYVHRVLVPQVRAAKASLAEVDK